MPVYSIDVKLCATAYVKARSRKAAAEIAKQRFAEGNCAHLPSGRCGGMAVGEWSFNSPLMPKVSFAQAVTFYGPYAGAEAWEMTTPG